MSDKAHQSDLLFETREIHHVGWVYWLKPATNDTAKALRDCPLWPSRECLKKPWGSALRVCANWCPTNDTARALRDRPLSGWPCQLNSKVTDLIRSPSFNMVPPKSTRVAVATASLAIYFVSKNRKRKRSMWSKRWFLRREQHTHTNLLRELTEYTKDYKNYLRMDEGTYYHLLEMVRPLIEKQDTMMRRAISPHERLTATLRFLATGRSFEDLKYTTCIFGINPH